MKLDQPQILVPGVVYELENLSSQFFGIPESFRLESRGCITHNGPDEPGNYHPGYGPDLGVRTPTPLEGTGFILDGKLIRHA
jgi:hypothetical protein